MDDEEGRISIFDPNYDHDFEVMKLTFCNLARMAVEEMNCDPISVAKALRDLSFVSSSFDTGVQATDALLRPGRAPRKFTAPRLAGAMRGTGCMLSSACAAGLAAGLTLEFAVRDAKEYVFRRIAANATARCGPRPSPGAIEESNGTW